MTDYLRTIPNEAWLGLLAAYVALVIAGVVMNEGMRREPAAWLLVPFALLIAAAAVLIDACRGDKENNHEPRPRA